MAIEKTYRCDICGKDKMGIHIRSLHARVSKTANAESGRIGVRVEYCHEHAIEEVVEYLSEKIESHAGLFIPPTWRNDD